MVLTQRAERAEQAAKDSLQSVLSNVKWLNETHFVAQNAAAGEAAASAIASKICTSLADIIAGVRGLVIVAGTFVDNKWFLLQKGKEHIVASKARGRSVHQSFLFEDWNFGPVPTNSTSDQLRQQLHELLQDRLPGSAAPPSSGMTAIFRDGTGDHTCACFVLYHVVLVS